MDSASKAGQIAGLAFRPSLVAPRSRALNQHAVLSHLLKACGSPNNRGGFSTALAKIVACIGLVSR